MKYIPYIDGLRGVAVLIILLFHLGVSGIPGGFVGVDVFFVISGYLITSIIAQEMHEGRFSFAGFYARRVRRIFPALFVMLFFAGIAAIITLGPNDYFDFFRSLRAAAAQLSNIYFDRNLDYFNRNQTIAPLLHTWSLGVEEQFYFFLACDFAGGEAVWRRKRWPWFLGFILVGSFVVSVYLVGIEARHAFYQLPSRAWQLALGGLVALNIVNPPRSKALNNTLAIAGIVMIAAASLFYAQENLSGVKGILPTFGAAMILYAGQGSQGIVHRLLSLKPLRWTGLISYSLYLWHWPVICFYLLYTGATLAPASQISLAVISFVLAAISYVAIEQPFRRIAAAPWKTLLVGAFLVVVYFAAGTVLRDKSEAEWRFPYHPDPIEATWQPTDLECSSGNENIINNPLCIIGPNKDKYEVVVGGDSTASHYMPMVLAWAKTRGLTVRQITRSACPTWFFRTVPPVRFGHRDTICERQTEEFHKAVQKSVRYVFVTLKFPYDSEEAVNSVKALSDIKAKVVFLGVGPHFKVDPHQCRIRQAVLLSRWRRNDSEDCLALSQEHKDRLESYLVSYKKILKAEGIPYFDPWPVLEQKRDGQGRLMFMDDYHLNRYGSEALAPSFEAFMKGR